MSSVCKPSREKPEYRKSQEVFLRRANIERFKSILVGAIDDRKRASVERLLAEEEEKLRAIEESD